MCLAGIASAIYEIEAESVLQALCYYSLGVVRLANFASSRFNGNQLDDRICSITVVIRTTNNMS